MLHYGVSADCVHTMVRWTRRFALLEGGGSLRGPKKMFFCCFVWCSLFLYNEISFVSKFFSNQNISNMFVFRLLMFLFCPLLKMADAIVLFRSVFRVFLFEGVTPRSYRRRVDVPGSNAHWMWVYRPEVTHWLSGCNVNLSSVCSRTYVDRLRGVSLVRWILCTVSVGLVWSASSFCSCSSSSSCWFLLSRTWTQVRHAGRGSGDKSETRPILGFSSFVSDELWG